MQTKTAQVIVSDDQLSLAIGKEGQNVRLAAKLTGWGIDIQGESSVSKTNVTQEISTAKITEENKSSDIDALELGTKINSALEEAGIDSVKKLKKAIESGEKIKGIGPKALEQIQAKI
jgi:hypothetical protein